NAKGIMAADNQIPRVLKIRRRPPIALVPRERQEEQGIGTLCAGAVGLGLHPVAELAEALFAVLRLAAINKLKARDADCPAVRCLVRGGRLGERSFLRPREPGTRPPNSPLPSLLP